MGVEKEIFLGGVVSAWYSMLVRNLILQISNDVLAEACPVALASEN